MDFSAWDWASHFRLHEAACLIAGVMPVSKRMPTSEELPPQARPILVGLGCAYYEWFLQKKNPERPKSLILEGELDEAGNMPPFPVVNVLSGEIISRAAIRRFLSETGRKSVYDFSVIELKKITLPTTNSASHVPDQKEQRQDNRLQACIDDGLPMNTKTALLRLPDGVGAVTDKLGLTRQAFSTDVKAALQRRETARSAGRA